MKTKGIIERWNPQIIGIFTTACYIFFLRNYSLPSSVKDLFNAALTFSSLAITFLGTALSILMVIDKIYLVQQLRNAGVYRKLVNYFIYAINWCFVLAAVTAATLLIDFTAKESWHWVAFAIWLFILTTTGFACYRVIDIFAKILIKSSD